MRHRPRALTPTRKGAQAVRPHRAVGAAQQVAMSFRPAYRRGGPHHARRSIPARDPPAWKMFPRAVVRETRLSSSLAGLAPHGAPVVEVLREAGLPPEVCGMLVQRGKARAWESMWSLRGARDLVPGFDRTVALTRDPLRRDAQAPSLEMGGTNAMIG